MATKDKSIRRGIELYIDGKKVRADFRMIQQEVNRLTREIRTMTIGSEEYNRTADKIKRYNIILRQHRQELRGVEQQQRSWLSKGTQLFKDYSLQIMGTVAAITNVTMKLNEFRRQAAEKEDAAANLKALTGLDDNNIQWLTQQAETLSTTMEASGLRVRKSATEILEAYMLVGSKKPELLRDKESLNAVTIEAMRLAEAAKMDLKDAVEGVTLAMNQYGASANEASRYVNVLAAGSKYGAVGVATQTESIVKSGVAASTAKVPIEQLVGVLETLGEKGIEGARAGTQLKTFLLKLESGAKDTRPSVVGLQTALERLAAKNLDATQMTKLFGLECYTAAQALISSADKVKYYTDAVTGTNVAVEQAAINSDTTAAKMAQVRNQINLTGQELAKTLAPIMSKTVGWTRRFVMAMPAMIDFLKEWGLQLVVLAATYYTLTLRTTVLTRAHTLWNTVLTLSRNLLMGYNTAMSLSRDMVVGCTLAQGRLTAALATQNTVVRLAVAGTNLLKAAYYTLTLQFGAAAASARAFGVALTSTGVGALIVALGVAVSYLVHLANKAKDAANAEKKVVEIEQKMTLVSEERRKKIEELLKKLHDEKTAYEDKKKALEELKRIAPGYQATLTKEGKLIRENGDAYRYLNQEMMRQQLNELIKARNEMSVSYNQMQKSWKKSPLGQIFDQNYPMKKLMEGIQEMDEKIKSVRESYDNLLHTTKTSDGVGDGDGGGTGGTGNAEKESEKQKRIRLALEKIDAEYNKRAADLKQQYINGEIKTEREYSTKLQQIEISRFKDKADVLELDEKQQSEFLERVKDIQLEALKYINEQTKVSAKDTTEARLAALDEEYEASKKYIEDAYQNGIIPTKERCKEYLLALERNYNLKKKELQEKEADEELAKLKDYESQELQGLRLQRAQRLLSEEQYEEDVLKIKRLYAQKRAEVQNKSKEATERTTKEEQDVIADAAEKEYEKLKEKNTKIFDELKSLAEDMGQAIADVLADSEKNFGDFLKEMLKLMLSSIEKMMIAYISEVTMSNIAKFGPWGLAKAAGEIALITAAFETAKAGISQMYTGGFTPDGAWNQPQGIVHSNEFVANRHAVRNPHVLPVLQLIDAAQRTGSIANLTGQQIASVATGSAPASPSVQSAHNHITQSARDPELTAAIHLLVRTATQATEAYKKPVRAYTFADGRGGVNEAQALLEKMLDNASRKS